jgi:hypothetical protein
VRDRLVAGQRRHAAQRPGRPGNQCGHRVLIPSSAAPPRRRRRGSRSTKRRADKAPARHRGNPVDRAGASPYSGAPISHHPRKRRRDRGQAGVGRQAHVQQLRRQVL